MVMRWAHTPGPSSHTLDVSPLDGFFTPLEAGLEKAMLTLIFSFGFPSLLSISLVEVNQAIK